jgi:hypothetical protein
MQPPLIQEPGKGEPRVAESTPIDRWNQMSAHDSAIACERQRHIDQDSFLEASKRSPDHPVVIAGLRARCVPAEYVYPPKPPSPR